MLRYGRIAVLAGSIVTLISLVIGFGAMFMGEDNLAKPFIALIPVGFVTVFAGLVATLLVGTDHKNPPPG